jgi:hypothetical protein
VAAEYDFNIAATKSDVFKFLEKTTLVSTLPILALDQKILKKLYY